MLFWQVAEIFCETSRTFLHTMNLLFGYLWTYVNNINLFRSLLRDLNVLFIVGRLVILVFAACRLDSDKMFEKSLHHAIKFFLFISQAML